MNNLVIWPSFCLWLIYYWLLVNREIARKNKNKEKYTGELLKKNIFYLFRMDNLFFLIMFYIYKGFNNFSVTVYLYFVFIVASLVYILYDINEKYNILENNLKKEKIYYFISSILMMIPVVFYFWKKDIANTCFYTLLVNFLVPLIIFFTRIIFQKIKQK